MKSQKKKSKSETIFLYVVLIVAFLAITIYRYQYISGDYGDSSLFENLILYSGLPGYENEFLKSIQVLIRRYVSDPAYFSVLNFPSDFGLDGKLITAHAYLIFPLIQVFSNLLNFRLFISIVAALITILPVLIAITLISKNGRKNYPPYATYLIIILACYPLTIWSGLGQFYPDRLFAILFPIFLLVLERMKIKTDTKTRYLFIGLLILNAIITERASLYVGICCAVYLISNSINRKLILFSALISFSWSYLYLSKISTDVYTSGFFDTAKSIQGLKMLILSIPTLKLIIIHMPGFILFRKMNDLRLILFLAAIPNVFGNIGGAEKIGWTTHYMTYLGATYVGLILVWVERLSSHDLKTNVTPKHVTKKKNGDFKSRNLSKRTSIFALAILVSINPNSRDDLFDFDIASHTGILGATIHWFTNGMNTTNYAGFLQEQEKIKAIIPPDARIGVSEETSKFLSKNYKYIYMFPVNIKNIDYAVLKSAGYEEKVYVQNPIVNYANPKSGIRLTEEIQGLLLSECFTTIYVNRETSLFIFKRAWRINKLETCVNNE